MDSLPDHVRRTRLKPLLEIVAYTKRSRARCFVCAVRDRDADYRHHIVYEDATVIAFLDRFPRLWGTVLVAPKDHREQVTSDFNLTEYLALQTAIHRIGESVQRAVPCERLYVLSLGSQQLNRHVHWHLAPLPPGVPMWRQQLRALSDVFSGVLVGPDEAFRRLAEQIRAGV